VKQLSGAQIFVDCLKREKVDTIFGFPGGAVLNLYDELFHSNIRHYLVRHEQAAVHAADGYARAPERSGYAWSHPARAPRTPSQGSLPLTWTRFP